MDLANLYNAVRVSVILASIGTIISTAEWIYIIKEFGKNGLYDWQTVSLRHFFTSKTFLRPTFRRMAGPVGIFAILLLRISAALSCLIFSEAGREHALGVLVFTNMILSFRCKFGLEGSDQMLSLITLSLWIGMLSKEESVLQIAVFFIALQAVLSYFVAGLAKLAGPLWRDGTAVSLILNTRVFGNQAVTRWMSQWPLIGKIATYMVLSFECTFPLAILLPYPVPIIYIITGLVFHFSVAWSMGLNVFVWAFPSSYPAIYYTAFVMSVAIN